MHRNLSRRVELMFPVENQENRQKVKQMLILALNDTLKARVMKNDGSYKKIDRRGKEAMSSQQRLYELAVQENETKDAIDIKNGFTPILKY